MNKIVLSLLLTMCSLSTQALSYSVNFDYRTAAEMTAAFATEAAAEAYYNEQTGQILKHYEAAGVASAGIYASKFLDRKALTNLDGWSSSTENYYYHRIYNMVSRKIIPKMWDCAGYMIKDPSTAVYWGSYLLKTCGEVKSLCQQFEGVVTNGTLSFRDIAFPELNANIMSIVKLTEIGGVNWQQVFDNIGSSSTAIDVSDIRKDIKTLYNMGVGLANSGWQGMANGLLESSQFHGTFLDKINTLRGIADTYSSAFEQSEGNIATMVKNIVGDNIDNLFTTGSYNTQGWKSDYVKDTRDTYYTQRWYIYWEDKGSVTMTSYDPNGDYGSMMNTSEWYRITAPSSSYTLSSTERERVIQNSESYSGLSRQYVNTLNAQNDGYTYRFSYSLYHYNVQKDALSTEYVHTYACSIRIIKSWYRKIEVYDDIFDSYSMDLETFKKQLQVKLDDYNNNEEGRRYYLASDSQHTYTATNADKMKGVESATITIQCSGGTALGEGTTQYKCGRCGSSVTDHTKDCSMETSLKEDALDTSELDTKIESAKARVTTTTKKIEDLENRQSELIEKMKYATTEYPTLRQQYNEISDQLTTLRSELSSYQNDLSELQQARNQLLQGEATQTDDTYRIPAIMNDIHNSYNLTWDGAGQWNGYTYTRIGHLSGIKGDVTFTANISIARKPKYFLGIKIHRAIVQISWKLTGDYSDTEVVAVIKLDKDKSDVEKAEEVNAKVREVRQDYPDCSVKVEYGETTNDEEDTSTNTQHLLWSSDRLSIAREIDSRLNKIYASLVCYEKMMHYKYGVVDWLKSALPYVNEDQGRRLTLVEKCHKRWLRNAANTKHSNAYNGKYED